MVALTFESLCCSISRVKLITCICGTASLSGFLYGYSMAASSIMITSDTFIQHFCVDVYGDAESCYSNDLTAQPDGWITYTTQFTAMLGLGSLVGAALSAWAADAVGRRRALLGAAAIYVVFTGWQVAIILKISMLLARFLAGIGIGIGCAVSPTYIMEVAPPALRGQLAGFVPLALCAGMLSAGVISEWFDGYTGGWRYTLALVVIVGIIMFLGMYIFPESPRWAMATEGKESCEQILKFLRQSEDVGAELAHCEAAAARDRAAAAAAAPAASFSFYGRFFGPRFRKRTLVACALQLVQQMSGIVILLSYGAEIIAMLSISRVMVVLIILYILNGIGTSLALGRIDVHGRRTLMVEGAVGCTLANLGCAVSLKIGRIEDYESDDISSNTKSIVAAAFLFFLAVYILFFASSFGLVPWVYASEVFPMEARATAVGLANIVHAGALYLATYYQSLITATTLAFTYLVCAALCALSLIFILLAVPETAGKSMEKIDDAFKRSAWDDDEPGSLAARLSSHFSWLFGTCSVCCPADDYWHANKSEDVSEETEELLGALRKRQQATAALLAEEVEDGSQHSGDEPLSSRRRHSKHDS